MQGLGSDFVILDWEEFQELNLSPVELARQICKRHYGVGAEGLMIIVPESQKADLACVVYSPDGTLASTSGNELCCFAKYVLNKGYIFKSEFSVETASGVYDVKVSEDGLVAVNMRKQVLEPAKSSSDGAVSLTGSADFSFEGVYYYND